jgi:ubiquinone/menaquinone biosynthesis C-methylase UbiE
MTKLTDTVRVRLIWERSAGGHDSGMDRMDSWLFAGGREWVCSQVAGDVLEVAVGTGRNLGLYPAGVRLTAIDLSPAMLARSRRRAAGLGRDVNLRLGDAEELDLADGTFDTVVFTLALCSIPDDRRAVAEARRVLRPGGRVLLPDHVRSPNPVVRGVERLLDLLTVPLQGDHLVREPVEHLRREGFEIERLERLELGLVERVPARSPAG